MHLGILRRGQYLGKISHLIGQVKVTQHTA